MSTLYATCSVIDRYSQHQIGLTCPVLLTIQLNKLTSKFEEQLVANLDMQQQQQRRGLPLCNLNLK